MKKQILLDALSLTDHRPKGAQVYIFNLLKYFSLLESDFEFTVLLRQDKGDFRLPQAEQIHYQRIKTTHPLTWRLLKLPRYLKDKNFALAHIMSEGAVLNNLPIPYIMAIHESLKKYYRHSGRAFIEKGNVGVASLKEGINRIIQSGLRKKMIMQADILIAISNNTKQDLIRDFRLPEDKVKVIYWAADEALFCNKNVQGKEKIYNTPYILIFATGDRRENVAGQLRAFSRIKDKINHYLYIVGVPPGSFATRLKQQCRQLGILERVVVLGFLNKDRLAAIYKNAELYVDLSFLEGFGLQVMEAMACGLPVITSNVDSLPEIVGDAGILLQPNDDRALANSILAVLKDKNRQGKMRAASREQAQKFSWKKTAEQTLKTYAELTCPRYP